MEVDDIVRPRIFTIILLTGTTLMSTSDRSMNLIIALLGLLVTVACVAVPWGYMLNGRLVQIETAVRPLEKLPDKIAANERTCLELKYKILAIEKTSERLHPE